MSIIKEEKSFIHGKFFLGNLITPCDSLPVAGNQGTLQTMNTKTIAIRRRLIAAMSEGLASVSDEKFNRIARAVAYLSRRMERSAA